MKLTVAKLLKPYYKLKGYLISKQVYMKVRSYLRDKARELKALYEYSLKLAFSFILCYTLFTLMEKLIGA